MTNFVALGDSITVGMGDPLPDGTWRGWAALLAPALGLRLHNLAVSGALSTEMEREQLPRALELRPALAAVTDVVAARYRTVHFDYHGGLRYPRLEKIPGTIATSLDALLTARP